MRLGSRSFPESEQLAGEECRHDFAY
jgi:hypothetical protein